MTGSEIAQMFLDRDGYVVMASDEHYPVGAVIRDDNLLEQSSETPGPFVIIGIASREDAERQRNLVPEEDRWPGDIWQKRTNFYKVTAE